MGLLEAQNRHLKEGVRDNERRSHRSIEIKQHAILEGELKLLKE